MVSSTKVERLSIEIQFAPFIPPHSEDCEFADCEEDATVCVAARDIELVCIVQENHACMQHWLELVEDVALEIREAAAAC